MTQTLEAELSSTPAPHPAPAGEAADETVVANTAKTGKKRKLGMPILLQAFAMIGIGALLYPSAADWFSTLNHNSEVSGYVREVESLPDEQRLEKLEIARQYNAHMPAGTLRDPYAADANNDDLTEDSAYSSYLEVLRVSDSGVIGEIQYPRLGIGLPIYHGTSEDVIAKGVGHFYGSSLPVGGPSTHAVLTSHSGLVNASLFTPLLKAQVGDTFKMTVLGETHYYEVDGIETIEPFVTDSLGVVQGEDRVTLVTCTPIGVNSHRMLVHGIRVPAPPTEEVRTVAGDGKTAGIPWWAVGFIAGSAVVAYMLFSPPKKGKKHRPTSTPTDLDPNQANQKARA